MRDEQMIQKNQCGSALKNVKSLKQRCSALIISNTSARVCFSSYILYQEFRDNKHSSLLRKNTYLHWNNINPSVLMQVPSLFFFAVYVIYKKKYSFCRVVFLFLSVQNCQLFFSFYLKINDSSMVRTTVFSSSRFGVRVSVVPNIFTIYP